MKEILSESLKELSKRAEKLEKLLAKAYEILWLNCIEPVDKAEMRSQDYISDFLDEIEKNLDLSKIERKHTFVSTIPKKLKEDADQMQRLREIMSKIFLGREKVTITSSPPQPWKK